MRKFLMILWCAAFGGAAAYYWKHYHKPQTVPVSESVEVRVQNPIVRLSLLVESHIGTIFSPLEGVAPPLSDHEIRQLRAQLVDAHRSASEKEKMTYRIAAEICDTLVAAMREREKANLSLADTRSKPYAAPLSADKIKEIEGKTRFFETGITRRWAEHSRQYRERISKLYGRIREEERKRLVAQTP